MRAAAVKVQQNVFRRCYFHILQYDDELRQVIEKNGGRVQNDMTFVEFKRAAKSMESTQTTKVKSDHFILVVNDGDKILNQIKEGIDNISIVHKRWIDESIKMKKMQDLVDKQYLYPFSYKLTSLPERSHMLVQFL